MAQLSNVDQYKRAFTSLMIRRGLAGDKGLPPEVESYLAGAELEIWYRMTEAEQAEVDPDWIDSVKNRNHLGVKFVERVVGDNGNYGPGHTGTIVDRLGRDRSGDELWTIEVHDKTADDGQWLDIVDARLGEFEIDFR